MYKYLNTILFFFSILFSQNSIDNYLNGNNNHITVGVFDDGIEKPRDLDFHPIIENQLWVLNQGDERYQNNHSDIHW